jgi:hypothetical protein
VGEVHDDAGSLHLEHRLPAQPGQAWLARST